MALYDHLLKIVVTGDSAVGKSCMLSRFVDDTFTLSYTSTIGVDFKIKTINITDENPWLFDQVVKLQIWDTAGQERFKTIVNSYYRAANIVFIVFDLSVRDTFMHIPKWCNEAKELTLDGTKIVMVGCKSDLKWQVTQDEIVEMSETLQIPWAICSACKGTGINELFIETVKSTITNAGFRSAGSRRSVLGIKPLNIEESRPSSHIGCCSIL